MAPINDSPVNSNQVNNISAIDGQKLNLIDLALFTGLNRADFLKNQITTHLAKIKNGNNILDRLGKIREKAAIAKNGPANYTSPSWNVNGNSIKLSNGYNLSFDQTAEGIQLVINDNKNNQIFYKNGVLIPTPAGKAVDALNVGIPIMTDSSLVLGDGTTVTFTTVPGNTAFNPNNLSGGLAQVSKITVQRGNQSLEISNANTANATVNPSRINANLGNLNYGHVLLENDGLDSWEYNGQLVKNMTYNNPNISNDTIDGLFSRKTYFKDSVSKSNVIYADEPYLTADEKKLLADLDIEYSDASGVGKLTTQEWTTLDKNIKEKMALLTGTSQYDYLALQRATANFTTINEFLVSFNKSNFDLLKSINASLK